MKTLALAVAALATTVAVAAPVSAQTRTVTTHTEVHSHTGPAHGPARTVCKVSYRHHHKVRECRTVR